MPCLSRAIAVAALLALGLAWPAAASSGARPADAAGAGRSPPPPFPLPPADKPADDPFGEEVTLKAKPSSISRAAAPGTMRSRR